MKVYHVKNGTSLSVNYNEEQEAADILIAVTAYFATTVALSIQTKSKKGPIKIF